MQYFSTQSISVQTLDIHTIENQDNKDYYENGTLFVENQYVSI